MEIEIRLKKFFDCCKKIGKLKLSADERNMGTLPRLFAHSGTFSSFPRPFSKCLTYPGLPTPPPKKSGTRALKMKIDSRDLRIEDSLVPIFHLFVGSHVILVVIRHGLQKTVRCCDYIHIGSSHAPTRQVRLGHRRRI